MDFSFSRYLSAKKTVDDRALNRLVWVTLKKELQLRSAREPFRVLELGMGIGTMLQRALEWGLINRADYTGIDALEENIRTARQIIPEWASQHGWRFELTSSGQWLEKNGGAVSCSFFRADVYELLKQQVNRSAFDLIIASAVLDLLNLHQLLPLIHDCLKPDGLGYFTINFDGVTVFEPVIEPDLEEKIIELYHSSMDERKINDQPSGDSRTGRHLYHALIEAGFEVLEGGSSDWVVFPRRGKYPDDEAYFLHFILHFFEETLSRSHNIDPQELNRWLQMRRSQIERGELFFLAHQLDFLVKKPQ